MSRSDRQTREKKALGFCFLIDKNVIKAVESGTDMFIFNILSLDEKKKKIIATLSSVCIITVRCHEEAEICLVSVQSFKVEKTSIRQLYFFQLEQSAAVGNVRDE